LGIKSGLRSDRGASQGFLYTWGLSLNLSLEHETVNEEVRVNIVKEIQSILRLYRKCNGSKKWDQDSKIKIEPITVR